MPGWRAVPGSRVVSYGSMPNRVLVSRDGRTTMGLIYIPRPVTFNDVPKDISAVQAALGSVRIAGAPIHVTGQDVLAIGSSGGSGPGLLVETALGGVGALLILIFVFRSFM